MRILFAAFPLMALAACNVTTDDKNDAVTVQYDENVAANAVDDVQNATAAAANEVKETATEVKDKVQNTDVDVDVDVKTDGTKATANAN